MKKRDLTAFTLAVTNGSDATRTLVLGKGLKNDIGQVTDGSFRAKEDRADETSLTGVGSPKTIEEFLAFVQNNPVMVERMKFKSASVSQTEVILNLRRESPFRNLGDENIALSQYTDEYTQKDNVVTLTKSFQLDDQTKLEIPVVGGSTVTITIEISKVFNVSELAGAAFARS